MEIGKPIKHDVHEKNIDDIHSDEEKEINETLKGCGRWVVNVGPKILRVVAVTRRLCSRCIAEEMTAEAQWLIQARPDDWHKVLARRWMGRYCTTRDDRAVLPYSSCWDWVGQIIARHHSEWRRKKEEAKR